MGFYRNAQRFSQECSRVSTGMLKGFLRKAVWFSSKDDAFTAKSNYMLYCAECNTRLTEST
ncbi:hypothetical protein HMPREF1981_02913 [Bacteroides pyogenes F0041]|uniref:Uncharacterized protein n=1 Tax=Bacteroides pyogenes F0041 TaxID=1321819 RepID=U2DJR3_9BACE|nr:hypothetical protein HMPREF1981_02913 [Bacteroides pyogenes F0041]